MILVVLEVVLVVLGVVLVVPRVVPGGPGGGSGGPGGGSGGPGSGSEVVFSTILLDTFDAPKCPAKLEILEVVLVVLEVVLVVLGAPWRLFGAVLGGPFGSWAVLGRSVSGLCARMCVRPIHWCADLHAHTSILGPDGPSWD